MQRYFAVIAVLLISTLAWCVPARRTTFTHTQKDGTTLTLMLVGDEHMHYYENVATGEAMELGEDGDYRLIAPAVLSARRQQADERRAEANAERIKRLPRMAAASTPGGMKKAVGSFNNMKGMKKGLVILVNFADKQFVTSNPQQVFNRMFNEEGYNENGHIGSVKDYFSAQSYGQFTVDFDVVGPVTVSKNMAYYGGNGSSGSDSNPREMITEAVQLANNLGVDYTKYDWTGDGYVDQVFIVYAGYGEAYEGSDPNTIWPHEWVLSTVVNLDGKKIKTYACTSELAGISGTTLAGIGTACHEFSHCLGYPDTYDADYETNGQGSAMGNYDIMAGGSYNGPNGYGEVPCGYSAYERWMAGWMEPIELSSATTVAGLPALSDEGEAFIIYNDENRNEYFLLENRQAKDWFAYWQHYDCGHGLFVYHVDYLQSAWTNNSVNKYSEHQRLTYVPADGVYGIVKYLNEMYGDFFPGDQLYAYSQVEAFTPGVTHTSAGGGLFTASTSTQNKTVTNIAESNGKISFKFMGGTSNAQYFTVTLNPCGGTVETNSLTQYYTGQGLVLPEPTCDVEGWYGIGWSATEVTANTPWNDIIDDIINYDVAYVPTANVTLYAVYANNDMICNSNPTNVEPVTPTVEPQLYFPYIIKVGETFAGAKLNTDSKGTLTYESSNTDVATVDAETGEVNGVAAGTAIITVTQAEDATHLEGTAKYMVKVEE